jgi:hypothetical protein
MKDLEHLDAERDEVGARASSTSKTASTSAS